MNNTINRSKEHIAATLSPVEKEALWLLLGAGLDDAGKEKWLAWRLERGDDVYDIFAAALDQTAGMVAT